MSHHVVPKRVYYTIFISLMVLTAITVWVAFQDFGFLNDVVAMLIASTKATLVILYFMHLKYSNKLTWVAVIGGVMFLAILLIITMSDYLSRDWSGLPQAW